MRLPNTALILAGNDFPSSVNGIVAPIAGDRGEAAREAVLRLRTARHNLPEGDIGGDHDLLFTLLTVLNIRSWLAEALPKSLKFSFAVGIGLFLTFIGLNETGIVRPGVPGAPVSLGNLPGIEKPMLADALATTVAPLLGTTTTGAFIESAAGIEEGGRTGFTALVVAVLSLTFYIFYPYR